ncbi:MBL fold metallo-hydrolase [Pseudonocardia sulfidoxydans NBRC 16205]|uniref:MBL fold metallo-hydrolase n=1 Tax=Pseudonocardia sulfidoxydans NBRC 16205 TaxID=1223511 RepID=A0A511DA23_9PSEU|nr:rhodanese-like domain-containing protein [Pseudonocardia sulfidoxydans]GEL21233.1 MBL fold metallo-hydrolase [Pseudonocardia sulfidoxydans NBRC 16205]
MTVSVETISTPQLGDRSYVVHDGSTAVVVDPQRDIDRVDAVLEARGLGCAAVVETHVHNDYVSGGLNLARRTGADYIVAGAEGAGFRCRTLADGATVDLGAMVLTAIATPGHTDGHMAYVVTSGEGPAAVFTGGSLLYGSVGRTDLVDPGRAEELGRLQFRSARRLAETLPRDSLMFPTHGFGSFCSATPSSGAAGGTLGDELLSNIVFDDSDEVAFASRLVAGFVPYPRYYAHMGALNLAGPGPFDLTAPRPADRSGVRRHIESGHWVVDLRDRVSFAAEHVAGTVNVPLDDQFATRVGSMLPWGAPLVLLGESADRIRAAQRQLIRIGIDRPAAAAIGAPAALAEDDELRSYPRATFAQLAEARRAGTALHVLDVREGHERAAGAISDSTHLRWADIPSGTSSLPVRPLWVHCAAGARAAVAASLLERAGHEVVLVDDDYRNAVANGLATA